MGISETQYVMYHYFHCMVRKKESKKDKINLYKVTHLARGQSWGLKPSVSMSMGYYHKDDLLETTQILPIISLFLKV